MSGLKIEAPVRNVHGLELPELDVPHPKPIAHDGIINITGMFSLEKFSDPRARKLQRVIGDAHQEGVMPLWFMLQPDDIRNLTANVDERYDHAALQGITINGLGRIVNPNMVMPKTTRTKKSITENLDEYYKAGKPVYLTADVLFSRHNPIRSQNITNNTNNNPPYTNTARPYGSVTAFCR